MAGLLSGYPNTIRRLKPTFRPFAFHSTTHNQRVCSKLWFHNGFRPNHRATLPLQAQGRGKVKVITGTDQILKSRGGKKKKTLVSHSTYKSLLFLKELCEKAKG